MNTDTIDLANNHQQTGTLSWALAAFMGLAILALLFIIIKPVKVLPVLAEAPEYELVDQHGEPFSSADLQGKVVLYDYIYTHCTTVCPAMTSQMLQVKRHLEDRGLMDDVALVSLTFDPERDTPERLRTYTEKMRVEDPAWYWLTGDLIEMKRIIGGEFGVYFEKAELDEEALEAAGHDPHTHEGYDFIHATVFTVVDGQGRIRSEYREIMDVDQVVGDVRLAVREQNAGPLLRPLLRFAHVIRAYP